MQTADQGKLKTADQGGMQSEDNMEAEGKMLWTVAILDNFCYHFHH